MTQKTHGKGLFARTGRICAVVAGYTARDAIRQVKEGLTHSRTIELRLDWLRNAGQRARLLDWLRGSRLTATFIATCRTKAGGGRFAGSVGAQLDILASAVRSGCDWCDVEVETLRSNGMEGVRRVLRPARILVSFHGFRGTPKSLVRQAAAALHFGGDGTKIAVQTHRIADSIRVLDLARRRRHVVAIPMGEAGLPARVLALREGGELAYAPVREATAPGQVSLRDMQQLYRAGRLSRGTRVYGIVGDPVGHSLSPLLHNTGFIERGLDAVYLPFRVEDLSDFLKAIPRFQIRGFSVTLPHKRSILRWLDECEPLAAEIGAVNTVVVGRDGRLYGCNTDYVGVLRALESRLRLRGSRVLVYGAGGAARAAAFALAKAGACVAICSRRQDAARHLARAAGGMSLPRKALRAEYFDAIVNATPVGMAPETGVSPLLPSELNCRLVMDLVYRPRRTELLRMAARKGCETVSGVEMFLAQGTAQWEIWTGKRCPEAAVRRAVLRALLDEERRGSRGGR